VHIAIAIGAGLKPDPRAGTSEILMEDGSLVLQEDGTSAIETETQP
jgi:hypothetical protein